MPGDLAAALPNPGEASFVPIAAVIGGIAGSAVARWRKLDRVDVRRWTEDGAFVSGVAALAGYLVLLVLGV